MWQQQQTILDKFWEPTTCWALHIRYLTELYNNSVVKKLLSLFHRGEKWSSKTVKSFPCAVINVEFKTGSVWLWGWSVPFLLYWCFSIINGCTRKFTCESVSSSNWHAPRMQGPPLLTLALSATSTQEEIFIWATEGINKRMTRVRMGINNSFHHGAEPIKENAEGLGMWQRGK